MTSPDLAVDLLGEPYYAETIELPAAADGTARMGSLEGLERDLPSA